MVTTRALGSSSERRTVVLDDDPTGSQEVTGVPVLLRRNRDHLLTLLLANRTVYVLTNTRAVSETEARTLLRLLREDMVFAQQAIGVDILVVQRGDSTLRGHVFAEIDVFASPASIVVLAPAFPAGGRKTVAGVHRVLVDGVWLNAADTEFADDPVFRYEARAMVDYVAERGDRPATSTSAANFFRTASSAPAGRVIVPDAETDLDLEAVAHDIIRLLESGRDVVVRCAAPLAAYLAGSKSTRFVDHFTSRRDGPVLIVVGSHTGATTRQLAEVTERWPHVVELDTDTAIADPEAAALAASRKLRVLLGANEVVTLATERTRHRHNDGLGDAARVMHALSSAVAQVAEVPGVVVAKGGITSAEIARSGFKADTAWVVGQVAPGISLWTLGKGPRQLPYLVVPGNMGEVGTLRRLVELLVDRHDRIVDNRVERRSTMESYSTETRLPPSG